MSFWVGIAIVVGLVLLALVAWWAAAQPGI